MNPSSTKLVNLWNAAIHIITEPGEESNTKAEHENRIRGQYNQLLNNLTSVSEITAYMFQDGKLTAKELEHIQQFQSTPIKASEELLNIIMKSSPDVYECFLRSLKKTKQHHVYQMLTISVEQIDHSGHDFVSEHSRLIQRNYAWLTEKLNPDHSLLAFLLENGVLSGRDYEHIRSRKDTFKKNEVLLSLISRKSSVDFKHFQDALNETLQSHINQKLTGAVADANCEHKSTTTKKTNTDSCPRSSGKRMPPKVPPKPVRQLTVTPAQPKPFFVQGTQSTVPSRLQLVPENHHASTQHNVNTRHVFNVETQFRSLQNELQIEVSTKIAALRYKRSNDNIWKILFEKILHESRQNLESQSRYKATEEKCERLRQETLQVENKFLTFQDEIQLEKTNTEKQIRVLTEEKYHLEASLKSVQNEIQLEKSNNEKRLREFQEKEYNLEASLKSVVNENEKLSKRLQESQVMVDNQGAINKQTEQKAVENDRLLSMQLNELKEQLKLSYIDIRKLYQQHKESESKLRDYMELERKHQQKTYEDRDRGEAIIKSRLQELEDQVIYYKEKLNETESPLRETEKKLAETETDVKMSSRETEDNLKPTNTNFEATEARPVVTQVPLEEVIAEERKAWREEVERLTNQIHDQRRLIDELQSRHKSVPILFQEAVTMAAISTNDFIHGLAILDKELFVAHGQSSKVEVYDSNKFSFSRRLNLKESIRPWDIGSCNRLKCLFIFDSKDYHQKDEIWRVDTNGKLIKKWSVRKDFGESLSVTNESNVILLSKFESKLIEYSPDGKLIREINLPSDEGVIYTLHAIKLSNGHYVVSHGRNRNEGDLVSVVDGDGKLRKSVDKISRSFFRIMLSPGCLSVDKNGFVIVADEWNSRVLLLDSDLEIKREILTKEKHGLRGPRSILIEPNNRIFVADNYGGHAGRIMIFEFMQ